MDLPFYVHTYVVCTINANVLHCATTFSNFQEFYLIINTLDFTFVMTVANCKFCF